MGNATFEMSRIAMTVSQWEIGLYAGLTNDYNPIHVDPDFAAQSEMGGVIAHGTMSLNLIWQWLAANFGSEIITKTELLVRFRRPVRIGDVIEASGALGESGKHYDVWVRNQEGVNVIEGTASLPSL